MFYKINKFFGFVLLGGFLLTLSACYRSVNVGINTYRNYQRLPYGFKPGSSFCLASGQNNNLLNHEIQMKLSSVLRQAGYNIKDRSLAEYYLVFDYETENKEGTKIVPIILPGTTQTTQGNVYGRGYASYNQTTTTSDTTTLIQKNYTYQTRKLSLSVFDAKAYRKNKDETVLWSGTAVNVEVGGDFRLIVDYLITALLPNFGKSTGQVKLYDFTEWFWSEHSEVTNVKKSYDL